MEHRYIDLIQQTFTFPQEKFRVEQSQLLFNEIPLQELIEEHGTPLRISYLPSISSQIQNAKNWFNAAIAKHDYKGKHHYSYCTKASHFSFVLEEALKNDIHLETSSAFDMDLVRSLAAKGYVDKNTFFICNGFKTEDYLEKITALVNDGFINVSPVLDNLKEVTYYQQHLTKPCKVGIRLAADEQPNFEFYTSRLGVNYADVLPLYREQIKEQEFLNLEMLHFFINTGIEDTTYYWNELRKATEKYCELKKICPTLKYLNIGGGFPIAYSLGFDYDYEYMIGEIISQIKSTCERYEVSEPEIFTEFGNYTVGESGAFVFKVLDVKHQNDKEAWYMIDGSLMTTIPDIWGMSQRYIMLPVNKWDKEYRRVNVGGISCDKYDYYNSEAHEKEVFLPKLHGDEDLYLGFFHIGAYQESLSGYGGTKHCLVPSPKHVLISRDGNGKLCSVVFAEQQSAEQMLGILGY